MSALSISISERQTLIVLRSFLLSILDSAVEVIRGQINRVAEPKAADFVVMTPIMRARLSTNEIDYSDLPGNGTRAEMQKTQITVQLDVHGPNSGDNAQIISTMLRDDYACLAMGSMGLEIQPLFADDPRQVPFLNGEDQIEERWVINAQIQINAEVSTVQQFADAAVVGLIDVDAAYPP